MCSIMALEKYNITKEELLAHLRMTKSRGPDMERILKAGESVLCFQRLSIMGLSEEGMQPFSLHGNHVVCNGELYGFKAVREELKKEGYSFKSDSDCEIILPMYEKYGCGMFSHLDAEFARMR